MTHADRIKKAEELERFAQVLRQKDGTVIQAYCYLHPNWMWVDRSIEDLQLDNPKNYRLKPEPKYRPMTPDDFVGVKETIWIRNQPDNDSSIYNLTKKEVSFSGRMESWEYLFESETFEYSIDGRKTWNRFRVEVAE